MLKGLLDRALVNSQTSGLNDVVEKEILHHDILYILHSKGLLNSLTFMGGTALRLCYGGNRLSEDLDFAAEEGFSTQQLNALEEEISQYLFNKYKSKVAIHKPQQEKGNTSTWKITIEKFPDRPDLPSQKMHIDVCSVSAVDKTFMPIADHYQINSPMKGVLIPVESLNELMADKMIAFAYRERRIKPRDVWDIAWLTQQGVKQDKQFIEQKLIARGKAVEDYLNKLERNLDVLLTQESYKKDFENEMRRFVPTKLASTTIDQPEFWAYLQSCLKQQCEQVNVLFNGPSLSKPTFKM